LRIERLSKLGIAKHQFRDVLLAPMSDADVRLGTRILTTPGLSA